MLEFHISTSRTLWRSHSDYLFVVFQNPRALVKLEWNAGSWPLQSTLSWILLLLFEIFATPPSKTSNSVSRRLSPLVFTANHTINILTDALGDIDRVSIRLVFVQVVRWGNRYWSSRALVSNNVFKAIMVGAVTLCNPAEHLCMALRMPHFFPFFRI